MNLRSADYLLTRFAHAVPGAMKLLGDLESDVLRDRLAAIAIDRPVFITGVARSGTTLLLGLLSQLPQVATHRYSDFPFLFTPVAWNRLQDRMGADGRHGPEAFEEPLWAHFFDGIHDPEALHRLTAADRRPEFDEFYLEHLRKVLMLRAGSRYVSKGNYNLARIEYLADLLPDARFLVAVRHPVAQVESMLRQHRLFSEYSATDPRVPAYMRAAGHFEFGPQRVPVNLDRHVGRRIAKSWKAGEDATGYAFLWNSAYDHGRRLALKAELHARIEFVRYEDFCRVPRRVLRRISRFCGFEEGVRELLARLPDISPRRPDASLLSAAERDRIWQITAQTAGSLGYEWEPGVVSTT